MPPLIQACYGDNDKKINVLLKNKAYVNIRDKYGNNPLIRASYRKLHPINEKTIKLLLDYGGDVDYIAENGNNPLILACSYPNNEHIIELLLNYCFNEKTLSIAFICVCSNYKSENVFEWFLKKNVNVNYQDIFYDYSPLHEISQSINNPNIFELLLKNGADVHARNKKNATPLHIACLLTKNSKIIEMLFKYHALVNVIDNKNKNPLHYALRNK